MREIERDEIMPKEKRGTFSEVIETAKCLSDLVSPEGDGFSSIASYRRDMIETTVLFANFKVYG